LPLITWTWQSHASPGWWTLSFSCLSRLMDTKLHLSNRKFNNFYLIQLH
jgi:hypothetical protein